MPDELTVSLSNFRAFATIGPICITPLTLLVGENSTGKTSFMAALRLALNLSDKEKPGYFNAYPFDLGSYEDIVHDSGNRSTSLRFSMTVEKSIDTSDSSIVISSDVKPDIVDAKLHILFRSNYGEVAISSFEFSFEDIELKYVAFPRPHFTLARGGAELNTDDQRQAALFGERSAARSADLRRLSYALFDFYFGFRPDKSSRELAYVMDRAARAFDAFISTRHKLYSSPPVRSVPRRVYTSSDDASVQDVPHAPYELNRVKRADRRRWARLNAGLTSFGKLSGLFTRFDITKLTRQDSGPFQVKVTVRGRSSNIADVGYGVSQALPLMTDLVESGSERSAFLFQQPEVHLHPKAQAALGTIFASHIARNSSSFIVAETHSDYLIDRLRIEVRNGDILPELITILYFESKGRDVTVHEIRLDRMGNLMGCPPQYRDFFIREQERVLGF